MNQDTIIFGCGLAGLNTALKLSRKDKNILVFEKEKYLGGRVKTIYGKSFQYESGCARYNDNHKNLIKLIKKYKLNSIKIPSSWKNINFNNKNKSDYEDVNKLITDLIKLSSKIPKKDLLKHTTYSLCEKLMGKDNADFLGTNHPYYSEIFITNAYDSIESLKLDLREDKQFYILQEGLSKLTDCMAQEVENNLGRKIKSNHELISFTKVNEYFVCSVRYLKTGIIKNYICKNLILAMDSCSLKKIRYLKKYNYLLNSVSCLPLFRIYQKYPLNSKGNVWFKDLGKIVTNSKIRYIIPIDKNNGIVMISYTDGKYSNYWKKHLDKGTLEETIENELNKLFPDIKIPKVKWTKNYYWKSGACYWKPNYDSDKVHKEVSNLEDNLYICGSNYSKRQAWMEGALESSNYVLNLM